MIRRFIQCDVFSPDPVYGNGLAVVLDAEGLSIDDMQRFAAWTNLAETTFVTAPVVADADYSVRIFTPGREMLFAGHPTLGSCMSWLHAGGAPARPGRVRQHCQIGVVEIDVTGPDPAFAAPPTQVALMDPDLRDRLTAACGLQAGDVLNAVHLNNGPDWFLLEVASAEIALAIDAAQLHTRDWRGAAVIGPHAPGGVADYETRNLAPSSGMLEDPITGSLNAAIAQWLVSENRLDRDVTIAQGTAMGRHGRVSVRPRPDGIWIGGSVHVVIEGTVDI